MTDYSVITELDLYDQELTELPDLSKYTNLKKLYCHYNKLTNLDNLPSTLTYLDCSHNELNSLNNLSPALLELHCSYNQLTILYNLPYGLTYLNCSNNPFNYNFELTLENIRKYNLENHK